LFHTLHMNRFRILFCIDNLEPDGAQRQLVDLIKNVDQSVYDISVCGIRDGSVRKEIESFGVPVDVIGKRGWWEFPLVVYKMLKYIRRKRPAILQGSLLYTNLIASVLGKLLRVPFIITVQHILYEDGLSWWMKPFALVTARLSDVTVTVFEKESILNRRVHRAVSIPNGIDVGRFYIEVDRDELRKRYGFTHEDIILFSAGRLSPQKGQNYLVQAISILEGSCSQIKLLIAGEGELRAKLEKLVCDLGLSSKVIFLGRRNDMKLLYQLCDIFVLPSVYEGFGLVVAEAMASRTPVIATEAVSVTNLISDNETGFLVPIMDSVAIAEKVKWVLEHPKVAKDVADAAYKRVKSLFSSQLMASRYMDLYQKLLSKKGLLVSV